MTDETKMAIFHRIKKLLRQHVPTLVFTKEMATNFEIAGTKTVKVGNKETEGIFFASAVAQKNHVGFYFFPIYTHPQQFEDTPQQLRQKLKGKSCFHIKKLDEDVFRHINALLKKGVEVYKTVEWI